LFICGTIVLRHIYVVKGRDMALMDRLAEVVQEQKTYSCKLMSVLASDGITEEERTAFVDLLDLPYGSPGRPTNVALAKALRAEGYDVSDNAVDRHRRGECSCNRITGGTP
jgi:hypothetical protein